MGKDTPRRWASKGAKYLDQGGPEEDSIYTRAHLAIEKARAEFLAGMVRRAVDPGAAPGTCRVALEILRRRDRDNWTVPPPSLEMNDAHLFDPDESYL